MSSEPLISICIPTYNGSQYIEKCIESCLAQSYRNIEIIVCDDCSSDSLLNVLNPYLKKDCRITFYQNEKNLGLVGNWNKCMNYASGEYIKWLFQDDWMDVNAIEEFVEIANKGYDFIVSKRNFILNELATDEDKMYYSKKVKTLENYFNQDEIGCYFPTSKIKDIVVSNIALNFIAEPSLIFFKRTLIKEVGLYDHLFHQICDLEYNMRLASKVGVYVLNKPICHFAIHAQSTTNANLNNKYFQLRFIEQAYYAYKLIHHNSFKSIQKLFSFKQKLKLILYYKYRMHEAKRYISHKDNQSNYSMAFINYPFLKPSVLDRTILLPIFRCIDLLKSR
ncbi:MAG: glycosyltransferase family 2 protein [Bacteroidia bacterium]|nr:glycosyltransferase family 2 protein [Bacteroidia bacterium]